MVFSGFYSQVSLSCTPHLLAGVPHDIKGGGALRATSYGYWAVTILWLPAWVTGWPPPEPTGYSVDTKQLTVSFSFQWWHLN